MARKRLVQFFLGLEYQAFVIGPKYQIKLARNLEGPSIRHWSFDVSFPEA